MEILLETTEIGTKKIHPEVNRVHSIEEVFDHIDNKFIKFYGDYGRKIVNDRRTEFNQDGMVNLKML